MDYLSRGARQVAHSASQVRLESLIAERLKPGADKAAIDARIWNLLGEHWTVMFTDLSGFSRHVEQFGIIHFIQTIYESHDLFMPIIDRHDGILLKIEGDSLLVIFRNPENGLSCAIEMQDATKSYNLARPPEEHVLLCVGLGCGDVLRVGDADVFGAEVNAASRLGEDVSRAGEILVTGRFCDELDHNHALGFEALPAPPAAAKTAFRLLR